MLKFMLEMVKTALFVLAFISVASLLAYAIMVFPTVAIAVGLVLFLAFITSERLSIEYE